MPQAVITTTGIGESSACSARAASRPFLARGGVARVVQVDQRDVEVAGLDRGQHAGRRRGGLDVAALALEQQAQRLEDVGLIVRDEDARALQDVGRRAPCAPRRLGRASVVHQPPVPQPDDAAAVRGVRLGVRHLDDRGALAVEAP